MTTSNAAELMASSFLRYHEEFGSWRDTLGKNEAPLWARLALFPNKGDHAAVDYLFGELTGGLDPCEHGLAVAAWAVLADQYEEPRITHGRPRTLKGGSAPQLVIAPDVLGGGRGFLIERSWDSPSAASGVASGRAVVTLDHGAPLKASTRDRVAAENAILYVAEPHVAASVPFQFVMQAVRGIRQAR